ncbi:MAG: hypothetical protein UT02_C0007G0010 [Parcubacteria group bacterium GW2011_GWC2_38_7]|nr:MAG: hypothetical protein UT02_C0007G0010 [Parcubacteria group bacterium GW2011_GWC2_38_7]
MGISSKYQKDYSNASFDNPRLLKKREQRKTYLARLIVVVAGIVFVSLIYLLFYASFFTVRNYEINGLQKIKSENIDNILNNYLNKRKLLIFSRRNYWLIDKTALKAEISKYYYFEQLEIKRKLPNKLIVNLVEKQPMVNWFANDLCFQVDLTGSAIGYCENNSGLLSIRTYKLEEVKIGDQVIGASALQYIINLHNQAIGTLGERYTPLYYELSDKLLTAKSDAGPEVRYNLELEIGEQVGRLGLLTQDKEVKDNYQKLKYIDLRFGDKIFYQ